MFEAIDNLEKYFQNKNQFIIAKRFISQFYEIIEDDKSFKKRIIDKARDD